MRLLAGIWVIASLLRGQNAPGITPDARAFIESHFRAAKQAESAGTFDAAITEYQEILKVYPKLVPTVYQNLGLVYYLSRKYDAAIETFNQGLQLDPAMVGAQLFLGKTYLEIEQPVKALPYVKAAHKAKPSSETAIALGLAYNGLRQYSKAAQFFRFELEKSQQKDNQLYFLGEAYLKESEQTANALAENNPNSKYDHLLAAKIMDSQARYQMAAKEYLEAGKKDPFNATIFFPLARTLAILGLDAPSALALNRYRQLMVADQRASLDLSKLPKGQAADVGPKTDYLSELKTLPAVSAANVPPLPLFNSDINSELRKRLVSARAATWKSAADLLLHAKRAEGIAVLKTLPAAQDWLQEYLIAAAHLFAEEYDKAAEVLDGPVLTSHTSPPVRMVDWEVKQQLSFFYLNRLLEEFPQTSLAHYLRARTLDAQGNKQAESEYQAAITADPARTEARVALADLYLSNSKYEEALAECQKALEVNAHLSSAKIRIGRIYIQLRDAEKGIPYIQSVVESDPDDAQARADLARGFELQGQIDKAVAEYERALKLDPSLNRVHYVLGRIYRKQGKTALADSEFRMFEKNESSERTKNLVGVRQLPAGETGP
jgi:tetratricopeptide (TPR) repeat protein